MNIKKRKSIAFLIDPIEHLDFASDSTLLIAKEFQNRGYELFYFVPENLIFKNNVLYGDGQYFKINNEQKSFVLLNAKIMALKSFSSIFIRQAPPFNQQYLTTTYLLESLGDQILMLNNPKSIRNITEKLSILNFKEFIPETIVSATTSVILDFIIKHDMVVLKTLYECAGKNVIKIKYNNNQKLIQSIKDLTIKHGYLMLQEYLPNIIKFGDKRVIFLDGEILGIINRRPVNNEFRVNMTLGSTSYQSSLTPKEEIICQVISKFLKKEDLLLVGIDIIDEKLIEINVTSPTGLVAIQNLYNINVGKIIVDKIEKKLKSCYNP